MITVDAIFFDVDGTLVDSKDDIANAMNYTLKRLGVDARPKELIVSYVGTGVKDLVAKCLGPENAGLAARGVEYFSDFYTKHSTDRSTLYPHVKEILEYFNKKDKYVITNRYTKFADATLKGLGIIKYFKAVLGGDDENCLKPAACSIERYFPELEIDKNRSIIVGDMAIDVKAGRSAGVRTIAVLGGSSSRTELKREKPYRIISSLCEILDIE